MVLRRSLLSWLGATGIARQDDGGLAAWSDTSPWIELKRKIRTAFPEVCQMSVPTLQRALLEVPRPVLLDARAWSEFDVSHLNEAIWTPDLASAIAQLSAHGKEVSTVVYCSVGWRSALITRQLTQSGYAHVFNLEGSLFEWANSGLPVYRAGHIVNQVHPYDARWGALLFSQLRAPL